MGQVNIITPEQELLLNEFCQDNFLTSHFYFTGGTALSLHYLQHRESVDLDFFSAQPFEPQEVTERVTHWGTKHNFAVSYVPIDDRTHVFNLTSKNNKSVKVDFAYYPYKQIEKGEVINGIQVDSLMDIAVNKLLTVEQRAEVKDFVDLYFLLEKFTIGDLLEGVKVKFHLEIDPFVLASDFLKVENFDFLPNMAKPLTLEELKTYFTKRAEEVGKRYIKE